MVSSQYIRAYLLCRELMSQSSHPSSWCSSCRRFTCRSLNIASFLCHFLVLEDSACLCTKEAPESDLRGSHVFCGAFLEVYESELGLEMFILGINLSL